MGVSHSNPTQSQSKTETETEKKHIPLSLPPTHTPHSHLRAQDFRSVNQTSKPLAPYHTFYHSLHDTHDPQEKNAHNQKIPSPRPTLLSLGS